MYDVIFADLDGTLLRDDKSIPQSNLDAIKQIINMGIEFVVCSGRSHMSLRNINYQLNLDNKIGYGIGFNGGSVFQRKPYSVLFEHKIDNKLAREILKFSTKFDVETMFYADSLLNVSKVTDQVIQYSKHSVIIPKRVRHIVRDCNSEVNKIILMGNNSILKNIQYKFNKTELSNIIDLCFSSHNLLEFNPININKGSGVKYIMSLDQFKGKKSIGIGDSYNDIPMFKECDLSIATANSDDEIKNNADYVTNNTNNDGILVEILEKYILK